MAEQAVAKRESTQVQQRGEALTPSQMLQIAVERGADMGQLEKLMDLHERWERNEARKAFVSAMNQFKEEPPKLTKNRHVRYKNNNGSITEYDHASLDHICEEVGAALSRVGISYSWKTNQQENGLVRVTCVLTHELGHSEDTTLQASPDTSGGKNSIQAVGSTVTYLQRYTLLAATGLATEDQDDDGIKAEQPSTERVSEDQALNIHAKLDETSADKSRFLRAFIQAFTCPDVQRIEEIPAKLYGNAIQMIENNAKRKQGAN